MNLEQITLASVVAFVRSYGTDLHRDFGLEYLHYHKLLASRLGEYESYPNLRGVPPRVRRGFHKRTPESIRGLEKLAGKGIYFPINLNSAGFKELNLLAAYVFFSGEVGNRFNLRIHKHPADGYYSLERLAEIFGLRQDLTRKAIITGSEGGLSIARLLYVMGVPKSEPEEATGVVGRSTKAFTGIRLPEYIMTLFNTARHEPQKRWAAYAALLDFINIIFITKSHMHGDCLILRPHQQDKREDADKYGQQISDILQFLFSDISFKYKIATVIRSNYQPTFTWERNQLEKFIKNYSGFVPFHTLIKHGPYNQLHQASLEANIDVAKILLERAQ